MFMTAAMLAGVLLVLTGLDRRVDIAAKLDLCFGTVHNILRKDLNYSKTALPAFAKSTANFRLLFVLLCALAMAVAMPQMDTLEPYESKGSEGLDREEEQPPKGRIIVIYVPIDADEYDELDYPYDILPEMDENSIDSTEMEIP
eukprot:snap_masked-scaffold172_size289735-processed-gene-0.12 protein:Tk06513 transcript:snap_masked-scaffold172_size289735-processed-gene-0.12-mRNA-1 annotation:"---NA---"